MLLGKNIIVTVLTATGALNMAQAQPQCSLANDDMCHSKDGEACARLGGYCAHGCESSSSHVCIPGLCNYGSKSSKTRRATQVQSKDNALRRLSGKTNKSGKTARRSDCECLVPVACRPKFEPDRVTGRYDGQDLEDGTLQSLSLICKDGLCDIWLGDIQFSTCAKITGNIFGGLGVARDVPQDSLHDFKMDLYCFRDASETQIDYSKPPASTLTGNMDFLPNGGIQYKGPRPHILQSI